MTDVLDVVLAGFNPLTGRQNGVKDVLAAGLSADGWEVSFFAAFN